MSNYGDFLIATIALVGIAFGAGEMIGRTVKPVYECEAGYVMAKREPDALTCWYERRDHRPLERKAARRIS